VFASTGAYHLLIATTFQDAAAAESSESRDALLVKFEHMVILPALSCGLKCDA
jgi:hypothetical protein